MKTLRKQDRTKETSGVQQREAGSRECVADGGVEQQCWTGIELHWCHATQHEGSFNAQTSLHRRRKQWTEVEASMSWAKRTSRSEGCVLLSRTISRVVLVVDHELQHVLRLGLHGSESQSVDLLSDGRGNLGRHAANLRQRRVQRAVVQLLLRNQLSESLGGAEEHAVRHAASARRDDRKRQTGENVAKQRKQIKQQKRVSELQERDALFLLELIFVVTCCFPVPARAAFRCR